jgi:hypothetical protein
VQRADTEDDRKRPRAVDLFSGGSAPVAVALTYLGWEVAPIDKAVDTNHNLADPVFQEAILPLLKEVEATMWAPPCGTMSRARDIPIASTHAVPRPLRSRTEPRGVNSLSENDIQLVLEANALADLALAHLEWALQAGQICVVENPARSWLWQFAQRKRIQAHKECRRVTYYACCFGGARRKYQALWGTVPLRELQCECHHVHCRDEWDLVVQGDCITFPSREEAEYTAVIAFNIAIAMTRAVIQKGWPLAVPPFLRPEETGDKRQELRRPPQCVRRDALPIVASQLCLTPPARSPGAWFLEAWTLQGRPYRTAMPGCSVTVPSPTSRVCIRHITQWTDEHLYIGRGTPVHPKSCWHNPYRVSRVGRREALKLYRQYIAQNATLQSKPHELRGRTLVCHCSPDEDCHGDILVELVSAAQKTDTSVLYVGSGTRTSRHQRGRWHAPFPAGSGRHLPAVPGGICQVVLDE